MREEEFKEWLLRHPRPNGELLDKATAQSRMANLKMVLNAAEAFGEPINIDEQFYMDGLENLLSSLKYSRQNADDGKPLPLGIKIETEKGIQGIVNGMNSRHQGVKLYKEFCEFIDEKSFRPDEYKNWLLEARNESGAPKFAPRTPQQYVSDIRAFNRFARRVNRNFSLDAEFEKDGLVSVVKSLNYSDEDQAHDKPIPFGIEVKSWGDITKNEDLSDPANIKVRIGQYKSSVESYKRFCDTVKNGDYSPALTRQKPANENTNYRVNAVNKPTPNDGYAQRVEIWEALERLGTANRGQVYQELLKRGHRRPNGANMGLDYVRTELTDMCKHGFIKRIDDISNVENEAESEERRIMIHPLNQILYGPPGTGKTYETAKLAVEICDGLAPQSRSEIMTRYNELINANRIAFTTFHQSIGYEDFVEGLRPSTESESGEASVGFKLLPQKGIFREICSLASAANRSESKTEPYNFNGRTFFKMSLGQYGYEDNIYDEAVEGNYIAMQGTNILDWTKDEYEKFETAKQDWIAKVEGGRGTDRELVQTSIFRRMKIGDIVIIGAGNLQFRAIGEIIGGYEYDENIAGGPNKRQVRWLKVLDEPLPIKTIYANNFQQQTCYELYTSKVNIDVLHNLIGSKERKVDLNEGQNFVLIIDEINRANISKVFGELITLLEPDKRIGAENQLKVTLPYSRDKFGVPNNLYIIGTMNTADRSIALLDTALRRRFEFKEIMPQYENGAALYMKNTIEGVNLGKLLRAINERIEYYFDRDHQIGHAYFSDVDDKAKLDNAMRHKILPLLAEYFFDDWEKIISILQDKDQNFVKRKKLKSPLNDGEDRITYKINSSAFPIEGFNAIINANLSNGSHSVDVSI